MVDAMGFGVTGAVEATTKNEKYPVPARPSVANREKQTRKNPRKKSANL
jgi:hypothetical protein